MHYKYQEAESNNEDDYYMYTDFMIYPYKHSRLEKFGLPAKETDESICISYFAEGRCVSTCQHKNPLPFIHNIKHPISELTNYFINHF